MHSAAFVHKHSPPGELHPASLRVLPGSADCSARPGLTSKQWGWQHHHDGHVGREGRVYEDKQLSLRTKIESRSAGFQHVPAGAAPETLLSMVRCKKVRFLFSRSS